MSLARILIVDDEEDLREILSYQLEPLGAEIHTAPNGMVALQAMRAGRFDAVLSDINMPEMTGLQFLAEMRNQGFETPFVILTGFGDKAKAIEALRLGAYNFLEKPWDAGLLRKVMSGAVDLGVRLRGIDEELEAVLSSFEGLSSGERARIRQIHRSLALMRIHGDLIAKKSA